MACMSTMAKYTTKEEVNHIIMVGQTTWRSMAVHFDSIDMQVANSSLVENAGVACACMDNSQRAILSHTRPLAF